MNAADLMTSPRLQRVYRALRDGREHSTRDLVWQADVCAVNSIIEELRANGCKIECRQQATDKGRIWLYRMTQGHRAFDAEIEQG